MNNLFLLPELNEYDNKEYLIDLKFYDKKDNNELTTINKSLNYYLKNIKIELDGITDWDKFKKLTFTYEFISTKVINNNKQICTYEPISRAFFKIYEIIYNTIDVLKNKNSIKSFHLAEGPGGFIEATAYYRNNKNDKYYGMTLIEKNNKNVPNWEKCKRIMNKYKNIEILTGKTKNGDLFELENFMDIYNNHRNSYEFITGDGGIDYSEDFNNQEQISINLIIAQILYALVMQKEGGSFVLKIFDCFHENTINIINSLSIFYKNVYICKPDTSRSANSEKYIICKNFRRKLKKSEYENIKYSFNNFKNKDKIFYSILDIKPEYNYLLKIEEINSILGQQQLENINLTLNFIFSSKNNSYENFSKKNKEKINNILKTNISKCIKWCKIYNFNYNNIRISF